MWKNAWNWCFNCPELMGLIIAKLAKKSCCLTQPGSFLPGPSMTGMTRFCGRKKRDISWNGQGLWPKRKDLRWVHHHGVCAGMDMPPEGHERGCSPGLKSILARQWRSCDEGYAWAWWMHSEALCSLANLQRQIFGTLLTRVASPQGQSQTPRWFCHRNFCNELHDRTVMRSWSSRMRSGWR